MSHIVQKFPAQHRWVSMTDRIAIAPLDPELDAQRGVIITLQDDDRIVGIVAPTRADIDALVMTILKVADRAFGPQGGAS